MLNFFFGLGVGLLFFAWRSYSVDRRLNEILYTLSDIENIDGLNKFSQLRRKVNRLNNSFYYNKLELKLYQELIECLPLGYLRISRDNYLIECNPEAQKLLQIERWEPNSLRFFLELVRSYELDQLIQQTRKTQKTLTIEWSFFYQQNYVVDDSLLLEQDDRSLFLKAYSYPLPEDEIVIFVENQQMIKDLINRRDQAYSDLSHELRTPLTSILLLVETLLKYTDDKTQAWLDKIYQQVNRLIVLVQNWLDIYQLEQNPYETLKFQNLNLQQLILSAWKSVEIIGQQKDISLEYQGDENITIEADINCLTQVFINLFDNSIKYSKDQSQIIKVLVSTTKESKIAIDLIDSGIGFNTQDLPYIFERLYRGDKSRTHHETAGTGLGLSIVKQIIEGHQGEIKAQNHPDTKGAWFQISLPIKQEAKDAE